MISPQIEQSIAEYQEAFTGFVSAHQLPTKWFKTPDHWAIKCADGADYEETVQEFSSGIASGPWTVIMDERRLTSARLSGPAVTIGNSLFRWLEIMEPRPGKGPEQGFVEHLEFVFPDFFEVRRVLEQRGVTGVEQQGNAGHAWVNIPIDENGREIKINDAGIEVVLEKERVAGVLEAPSGEFTGSK